MNPALLRAGGRIATAGALVALLAANAISNAPQPPDGGGAKQLFGELPLSFVENRGQWDTPARFVARRGPMVARLEQDALVVELRDRNDPENAKALVLRLAFENVSEDVRLEGEGQQPGVRNYFLGSDPKAWRSGVPGFGSVLYRGLQDRIDLRVRDRDGRLEYDLLLAPGADLGQFTVRCEGAESLAIEPDGSLALRTALGPVRQTPPATWYVLPSGNREAVDCSFVLLDDARYGFEIPDRDPGRTVVIDPGLEWSTFLGGSADDRIYGVASEDTGDVIVAGRTLSTDFPNTTGLQTRFGGIEDAFVARLDPRQSGLAQLEWATYLGGSLRDRILELVLDDIGNIYVVGQTASDDFPWTTGSYDTDYNGGRDAFVAKLDGTGAQLLYSTFLGGSTFDTATTIALRAANTVALAGVTGSTDFPTTPGAFDGSHNGLEDFFTAVLELGANGSGDLLYSTYLGGAGVDGWPDSDSVPGSTRNAVTLVTDGGGDLYVTGFTTSPNFPWTQNAYSKSNAGARDAILVRLRPDGLGSADLLYSTYVGGSSDDFGSAIAVEPSGIVTLTGATVSPDFPTTPGAFDTIYSGDIDGWLLRLDPAEFGNAQLLYSTYVGGATIGGGGQARGQGFNSVALDGSGRIIAVGRTGVLGATGSEFPTTCGAYDVTFNGGLDGIVVVLDPSGNGAADLVYSSFVGGTLVQPPVEGETLLDFALLEPGPPALILAAGSVSSDDYPTTPGAHQSTSTGPPDGVVFRMELAPQWSNYCSTAPNSVGTGALIDASCLGSASIADNTFELLATGAIPGQSGLFYYGPEQQQVPFGDGFRCVAPGAIGVFRLNPPLVIDGSGAASRLVDFTQPPASAGPGQITAGWTWNFQFWYRDPAGPGGTTFNLSDALSVTFTP